MSAGEQPRLSETQRHFVTAKLWHVRGKWERAIRGYREVIRREPEFAPAHLELGWLLQQQGRLDEARDVLRGGLAANPESGSLRAGLEALRSAEGGEGRRLPPASPVAGFVTPESDAPHIVVYMDTPDMNGAGQSNHLLMLGLREAGFEVTCIQSAAAHAFIDERRARGVQHLWIRDEDLYDKARAPRSLSDGSEAEALFETTRPDFVIFCNGSPVSNLAAERAAAGRHLPFLAIVHCATEAWAEQFGSHLGKLDEIYRAAREIVAVSEENLALLRRSFHLPNDQGRVIHNGRPASFFAARDPSTRARIRRELAIPDDAVLCATTARMEEAKGYQYQLRAMEALRALPVWSSLHFAWAGCGSLEARLRAAAEQQGVGDRIRFLGNRSDVTDLLDAADLFVLPSQFEGMPLSILEAMAKGLPVVATAVSGIPEALGDTGALIPDPAVDSRATVAALARTIEAWSTDPAQRRRVGAACKARAERAFRAERMVEEFVGLVGRAMSVQ